MHLMTYHSRFFVEVDSDWSDAVGECGYEQDQDLNECDPVGEVGSVVASVPAQLPFPVRLGGSPGHPTLTAGQYPWKTDSW